MSSVLIAESHLLAARDINPIIFAPIIIVLFISFVGLMIFLVIREKKRSKGFSELGLPFFPNGDVALQQSLSEFPLFKRGHSRKTKNMLRSEAGDIEIAIFDYRFVTGHGKHRRKHTQSVIYYRSPTLALADFAIQPESFMHKIGSSIGFQDIDFPAHPEFSDKYLLRGIDEQQVRDLFTDERIAFFLNKETICVQGNSNQMIMYRRRKRIMPEDVDDFMAEGLKVYSLFCN